MSEQQPRKNKLGYNERLFDGRGLRSYLHGSRFDWIKSKVSALDLDELRVVELGCFDGRLIGYLPKPPELYAGLDAGWEGGLARAQSKYAGHPRWSFRLAKDASALADLPDGQFNIAAAMETIEHIPPALVDDYLKEVARVTRGHFFISVPNEKGLVFLSKWLTKTVVLRSSEDYTARELVAATLGHMDKVERNEHKGFDYDALIRQVARYFDIVSVEGLPGRRLPVGLAFTVGITARSKT